MAYEKQTFVDHVVDENGDVLVEGTILNKAIMDHIEDGIVANETAISKKQDKLTSGTNIKTVNGQSLLGSGNITIEGGGSGLPEVTIEDTGKSLKVWAGMWAPKNVMFNELGGLPAEVKEKYIYTGTDNEMIEFSASTLLPDIIFLKVGNAPLTKREMEMLTIYFEEDEDGDGTYDKEYSYNGKEIYVMEKSTYLEANSVYSCTANSSVYGCTLTPGLWVMNSDTVRIKGLSVPYISVLPEVTEANNGKVLKVENGAWAVGSGGGASSWNDLTDKPFGDIVYSDSYSFAVIPTAYFDFAGQSRFYKVSDLMLTYDQLLKTEFTVGDEKTTPKAEEFLFSNDSICGIMSNNIGIGVAYKTGSFSTDYGVLNIPQTGVYFGWPINATPPANLLVSFRCEDLKQIDAKYLPYANGNEVAY